MNPKNMGNIRVIIRCWAAWDGSIVGDWVIFCCTNIVRPERPTRKYAMILPDCIGWVARSMPKKPRLTGTMVSSTGNQLYSRCARPARFSGVKGTT